MANLPSQHPTLSIHLSDLALTPLITSSSSPAHLDSLTALAASALSAQTAAQRAHLGRPQRIMVEYPDAGAVVLQSYLDPAEAGIALPKARHADADADADRDRDRDRDAEPVPPHDAAPALVGLVVAASSDEAREARRAAVRLERVAREFQREWMAQAADPAADDRGPAVPGDPE